MVRILRLHLKLVINYGIRKLKLYKILALAHEDNHGSIRILEKLDFLKKNNDF